MTTARIPIGVEVERHPCAGPAWRVVRIRPGARRVDAWTVLAETDGVTRFYAGTAPLVLHAAEAPRYAALLAAAAPAVTVVLDRAEAEPGWTLRSIALRDPRDAAPGALVAAVAMPPALRAWIADFAAHHGRGTEKPAPAPEPAHGFLDRWSRMKREERHAEPAAPPSPAAVPTADAPEDLPPLESLRTRADYAAFLRPGVPTVLRLAALRQAWSSDPAIAGHKPLVDYDWNFNAPGYGRLLPADDARQLVERLFRHLRERTAPEEEPGPAQPEPAPAAEGPAPPAEPCGAGPSPSFSSDHGEASPAAAPRRHGSAAPT